MPNGIAHSREIIHSNVTGSLQYIVLTRIDDRHIDGAVAQILFHSEGQNGDSLDLSFLHARRTYGNVVRAKLRVCETYQYFIAAFHGGPFEVENDLRKKRIAAAQFRHDEADGVTSAARQGSGLEVWPISDLLNHSLNAANQPGVNRLDVIDDSGYGGMRDPRSTCNFSYVQSLSSHWPSLELRRRENQQLILSFGFDLITPQDVDAKFTS
jgi:hypothetical protein